MASDSSSRHALSLRAMGQFPISIATSLALESAAGILPEAPTDAPAFHSYNLIMINVRTLMRNLYGSVEKVMKPDLNEHTLAETLSNEMRAIESIVAEKSDGRCECIFYNCSYADLAFKFSRGILKTPTSPGQVMYDSIEKTVYKILQRDFESGPPIQQYIRSFPNTSAKTLLMTHYPIDLLQRYQFGTVALLESHTGTIKPPALWNSKLQGGKQHDNIPFDRMTLQLFGDGITFSPFAIKIKQKILELATAGKWTAMTTKDLIIKQVEAIHDPTLEVLIKDLYRK